MQTDLMDEMGNRRQSIWVCDQCNRYLYHGEFRLNCTVCQDYDFCEECFTRTNPPHPHRMDRELAYESVDYSEMSHNTTVADCIRIALTLFSDRHCLGTRDVDKTNPSVYTDTYSWLTFNMVRLRAENFGQGLRTLVEPRSCLGICAENRPEWIITDIACAFHSIITVPIHYLLTDRELVHIVNNSQISIIVCDKTMLPKFIELHKQCPSLKRIVSMDPLPKTVSTRPVDRLHVYYMENIENVGTTQRYDSVEVKPDDCMTIIYTSGSSGLPKGTMVSEYTNRFEYCKLLGSSNQDLVHFCYEPLAWVTGRNHVFATFFRGGRSGFSTGDVSRLMEELALVRPHTFSGTPAIWNKIYAEFKAALTLATAHLQPEEIASQEDLLLQKFSQLIPARCRYLSIGGAMVSPVILDFMKRCFPQCNIYESYGITECGSVAFNGILDASLQYHVVSVPEMGYTIEDEPFPRGELLVKTDTMFSGYMNNPEETKAALTDDGFYRTGDIVELQFSERTGTRVRVIDRKKNFFKLSQGQYVSPELLQGIYMQSPFVEQIYIHGDLLADSVAAVIVPNLSYTQAFIREHNIENFDPKKPDSRLGNAILRDLRSIAEKESLKLHEIPSQLIIDFDPFTPENGLLTLSMKPCRPKLAAHYGNQLKHSQDIQYQIKNIIETTTQQSLLVTDNDNIFIPTSGDSLTAVRLSRQIEKDLGISIPSSAFLQNHMTLHQLMTIIENPNYIHHISRPDIQRMLTDCELNLNITINQIKDMPISPSRIFLTGSTGFVGAFLLAELLAVYPCSCKVICLVRADSLAHAFDRIKTSMAFYQLWREEYAERIIALAGNLEQNRLGLDNETYENLVRDIDIIFHCGASVNFAAPYDKLYGSNVYGTREIIRLATYGTACTPVHYISTISVLDSETKNEKSIDKISPEGLTNGYAQSKWVAENLVNNAKYLGLPVTIYRLGSTSASTKTGACNQNDLLTLLLRAMIQTYSYPETLVNAHLSMLPVDFTAESIVYLSRQQQQVYGKIYHVINPNEELLFNDIFCSLHQCGISLERVSTKEWQSKLKANHDKASFIELIREFLPETFSFAHSQVSNEEYSKSILTMELPSLNQSYTSRWVYFVLHHIICL